MRSVPSLSRSNSKKPKDQKKQLTIFCEDANASPDYFYTLKRIYQNTIVEISEIVGAAGVPTTIAAKAVQKQKEIRQRKRDDKSVDRDQVWAVFDRDDHVGFEDSIQLCGEHGVGVGFANPCFELWILLHQKACHNSADDRHQLQKKCEAFLPGYDPKRSKTGNFEAICPMVETAERNADWLERFHFRRHRILRFGSSLSTLVVRTSRAALRSFSM